MSKDHTPAEKACEYIMGRVIRDGQVAYLLGPGSEAYRLLTDAIGAIRGESGEEYRAHIGPQLRTEAIISRSQYDELERAYDALLDGRNP